MLDAFSRLGLGAIGLDHDKRVVELNDEAQKFLGSCIRIVDGRLGGIDRGSNEHFQSLIAAAVQPQGGESAGQDSFVLLPGLGARPVIAYASPIPSVRDDEVAVLGTIILLVSQDAHREPNTRLLEALFALTPAEMRLAVALARGLDLQSIARLFSGPKSIGDNGDTAAFHEWDLKHFTHASYLARLSVVDTLHASAKDRGMSYDRDLHSWKIQIQTKLLRAITFRQTIQPSHPLADESKLGWVLETHFVRHWPSSSIMREFGVTS